METQTNNLAVCNQVWSQLTGDQQKLFRFFFATSRLGTVTYQSLESLQSAIKDMKQMVLARCSSEDNAEVFWTTMMQEGVDAHMRKLQVEV